METALLHSMLAPGNTKTIQRFEPYHSRTWRPAAEPETQPSIHPRFENYHFPTKTEGANTMAPFVL
jgi:hypothetical protein